ncbi:MAG: lytic transglycosylase domain-containing protein [Magnetococcales bacterium]|nr:lytic transglycosylase domain-containing protein [Magnetococcales bacterium]
MIQRFFILFILLALGYLSPPAMAASEGEGARFRSLFLTLEGEGSLASVMDRSQWPSNDRLTSYLEYELLYHPKYKATTKRLTQFVKRWPNHPEIGRVRYLLELRITRYGKNREALAWYDHNKLILRSSRERYMKLLLEAGRKKEGRGLWRSLYTEGASFSPGVLKQMASVKKSITLAEHEKRARIFLRRRDKERLRSVLSSLPRDKKYFFLALEAAKNSEVKFNTLLKKLSQSDQKSPELWLARIDGLRRHGFRHKAHDLLMGREGGYLTAKDRQRQRFRLARLLALHNENKAAVKVLEPNVRERGGELEDSLWLAGWYAHESGLKEKARRYFIKLAQEAQSENRQSQGAYWAARTAPNETERKRWLKQAATYRDAFYGLLAMEEGEGFIPVLPEEQMTCNPLFDPKLKSEIDTFRLFFEARRNYYIGPEIKRVAKEHGLSMTDQLCLAEHFNVPSHMVKTARILKRKGENYWSGLYPVPIWKPRWGWQIDPSLVWGMARQESLFFHRARSSANAHGLLQLLPATARQEASQSGFPASNPFRLKLPDYNLAVGQAYMKRMLTRFDGDLILALTAYNAGPARADRWWKYRRMEEPLTFIENIPIGETRHYVKRVIRGWMIYQLRLYGAASLQSALGPGQPGKAALFISDSH